MTDEKKPEEDVVSDEQLDDVAGGAITFPNVCVTPAPGGSGIPTPFPNSGMGATPGDEKPKDDDAGAFPDVSIPGGD
jgi:hypothetical protein